MLRRFVGFILLAILLTGCGGFERRLELPQPSSQKSTNAQIPTAAAINYPSIEEIGWGKDEFYLPDLRQDAPDYLNQIKDAPEYHIKLTISKNLRQINGSMQVKVVNKESQDLDRLVFHLFPDIFGTTVTIANTTVNDLPVKPSIDKAKGQMTIKLTEPLLIGKNVIVKMDFSYAMPEDSSSNYNVFSSGDGLLSLAHFYPILAVYDDHGWHSEKPSMMGDPTYGDAARFLVEVIAPDNLTLIASGVELKRMSQDHSQTVLFTAAPARDFYLVAAENLVKEERNYNGVTINSYSPPGFSEGSTAATRDAEQAIKIFDDLIGLYPYSELDLVTTNTFALGVEYPGMIALAKMLYEPSSGTGREQVRMYEESVIAHEVGHQWFYNMVGNDQLNDPWMDESLTQFITYDYYRYFYSTADAKGFLDSLYSRWDSLKEKDIPIGLPVTGYDEAEYSGIVYGRGPIFFVEMEKKIGEKAMKEFLKKYWQDYLWGIATPSNLETEMEEVCSCDLSAEFQQWVGTSTTK